MLRVRGLTARIADRAVLDVPSFDAPEQGILVVEGGNGSGKSLLLDILAGLSPLRRRLHVAGEVRVAGTDALAAAPGDLASIAPLLPQRPEDVLLATDAFSEAARRLEAASVPEAVGCPAVLDALARLGVPDPRRGSDTLSTGEARRVAFAGVLALALAIPDRVRVVLLDEPLEGLDPASATRVREAILDLASRCLVVVAEPLGSGLASRADAVLALGDADVADALPVRRVEAPAGAILIDADIRVPGVLDHARLRLGPGLHVLTGANGAGKTTLLRALCGVHPDAEGCVRFADVPPPRAFPGVAGACLPGGDAYAFAATVAEECGGTEACAAFGLAHAAARVPHALSGGEARRLAVARALRASSGSGGAPRVVLLDEPTGHQDARHARLLAERLAERARVGACILAATHDEGLLARATTVLRIEAGRLRVERTPGTRRAVEVAA